MKQRTEDRRSDVISLKNAQRQSLRLAFLRRVVQYTGAVSPRAAARLALRVWMTITKRKVQQSEQILLEKAERLTIETQSALVRAYRWGASQKRVLMCHGWEDSAATMLSFLEPLLASGYQVVALDAPGHGASSGSVSSLRRYSAAISAIWGKHGPFEAVVAHSIGATAAVLCLAQQSELQPKMALIAGVARPESALEAFCHHMGLSEATRFFLERYVSDEVGRSFGQCGYEYNAGSRTAPVLLVHDRRDRVAPYSDMEKTADLFRNSSIHSTTALGHKRILADRGVIDAVVQFIAAEPMQASKVGSALPLYAGQA